MRFTKYICSRLVRACELADLGALLAGALLAMALAVPLACAADGVDELREIADNVRANEQLYRDIELVFQWTYDLINPAGGVNNSQMKRIDGVVRCVLQDGMLYFKIDATAEGVDGERVSADTQQAFDGERTRVYERQAFANVYHGRFHDARVPRPHTLIFRMGQMAKPLSAQLLADDYNRSEFRAEYDGVEEIDELDCVKVRVNAWPKGEPAPPREQREKWWVWLATDRNYLPVKVVGFVPGYSAELPIQVGVAKDLREIAPGVWFPFQTTVTVFNELELSHGNAVVSNVIDYVFSTAVLEPKYSKSLFSDVRFPAGAPVYEVQGGKIIRSWTEGDSPSSRPITRYAVILFNVVTLLLIVGSLAVKRRRARRSRSA